MRPLIDKHWSWDRGGYFSVLVTFAWSWGFNLELDLTGTVYFYFFWEFFGSRIALCWWGNE